MRKVARLVKISAAQCRAARGLLGWSQSDLAVASGVTQRTIASFELGDRQPLSRTLDDLIDAFEAAGIQFITPQDGIVGQGVALRWGMEPPARQKSEKDETDKLTPKPEMTELCEYWRSRPDEWLALSPPTQRAVLREIFGEIPDFDPITDRVGGQQ